MVSFPYHSHTTPIRIPKDMGMVWEAYHKGVPVLGVPGITLDIIKVDAHTPKTNECLPKGTAISRGNTSSNPIDFQGTFVTRWWQLKYFWNFLPYLGKISNLKSIFFRWVGSTTNQVSVQGKKTNSPFNLRILEVPWM